MPTYTYGSFQLNNNSGGLGYFLMEKNVDAPLVTPVTFSIARRDGVKKSGEQVKERTVTALVKVVGSSRLDLMSRLDTLMQNLSLRAQLLTIHEDGRYFTNVDAIAAPVKLSVGKVVAVDVTITFTCYDPYAYYSGTASTYDTGTVSLTVSGGTWNFPATYTLTGGGSIYSYPFLRITNKTTSGSTNLTANRNSGTSYTSLAVNSTTTFSGLTGDTITISHAGTTQTLTVSSPFSVGATTINVTGFIASANYVVGDGVTKITQWTALTVTQTTDNLALVANHSVATPLPNFVNDYVDIQCDPTVTNGYTTQTNSNGLFIEPVGLFPVMEPTTTAFTISIACASAISADAVFSWTPRYAN